MSRAEHSAGPSGSHLLPTAGRELRDALARPGFYPGLTGHVEVLETHVSWVFLAGERAYKLKKPLVLPFVDYGTAARRHEMCREEVRLNRRAAADVYLGVRAIAASGRGFELAAEDDPRAVDYVVEMRRFDERRTMAGRLARGELRDGDVIAVARLLARFHEQARRVHAAELPALTAEHRQAANFSELLALVEQRAEVERVLALERSAHAFVAAHAGMLDGRVRQGLVREGHGDLRAEHVLLEDQPAFVDCIEFDPALRELDVADDLAFLAMDLTARGGERFARALVGAYRDAGGDPGPGELIAFYAGYRALVRAKVHLLRAAQQRGEPSGRARHSAAARDLLGLAERFAWRARMPLVIVTCGLPGSGKSHLARALAAASGLGHLSSDVTRKRLAGLAPTQRAPESIYTDGWSSRTYAELGRLAARAVADEGGALVDATFRHRADRDAFAQGFADAAPLLFVELQAPRRTLLARAAQRDLAADRVSDASAAIVARESAGWEPLEEVAAQAHVVMRSDRAVEEQLADLLALLDGRAGGLARLARETPEGAPGSP